MRRFRPLSAACRYTIAVPLLFALCCSAAAGQETPQKPAEKPAARPSAKAEAPEKAVNPAQIELLETKVRFEANGDSRKEVHAVVKINSEIGVRQFARLTFDFNRSFESVDIPLVHITHATGGTADILPSAISDQPNPAAVNAPAYQDVRVKSVRILGLQPGDRLEYRVIKTVSHHPLAPDFWLDHTFDRSGVVTRELFELDVPAWPFESHPASPEKPAAERTTPEGAPVLSPLEPAPLPVQGRIQISPQFPEASKKRVGEGASAHFVYNWDVAAMPDSQPRDSETKEDRPPDITVSSVSNWFSLAQRIKRVLYPWERGSGIATDAKTTELIDHTLAGDRPLEGLYRFVSEKIKTIDLPLGATGFRPRAPKEIWASGYATAEDKAVLFLSLIPYTPRCDLVLFGVNDLSKEEVVRPSLFRQLLLIVSGTDRDWFLNPAVEVAPYGVVPANLRGKHGLVLDQPGFGSALGYQFKVFEKAPLQLPFPSFQRVKVKATLGADGNLAAKVNYEMRGDNELVLRVAFHQSPKEKWKELAQLLSITDGFRGQVSSVNASDPYATKEPFTLDYEIEQPKFVDWSKKTVRIPALLPQLGLPEPAGKPAPGASASPIDLGTPLDVQIEMSLQLPPGTTASAPTGTSVERDYATYSSQYSVKGSTITGSRHIHFLLREIPAARAADYNAFLHAVQSDEAQDFTLEHNALPVSNGKSHP